MQQSIQKTSDWVLLSRVFELMYFVAAQHKTGQSIHLTPALVDAVQGCVKTGIQQQNYLEMISFYAFATFIGYKEDFWPPLISKAVVKTAFKCFAYLDLDHDHLLKDFYVKKRQKEQ